MKRYIRMENKKGSMEAMRAYKFRIYHDMERQAAIDGSISMSQRRYNRLLEKIIEAHKSDPSSKISQMTINQFLNEIIKEDKTYLQLYAHVMVGIRNRRLKAYQNFSRRYIRNKYGMQMDSDISASISILNRATLVQRGSRVNGESVRPQREAVLAELRTYPANAGEANDLSCWRMSHGS